MSFHLKNNLLFSAVENEKPKQLLNGKKTKMIQMFDDHREALYRL